MKKSFLNILMCAVLVFAATSCEYEFKTSGLDSNPAIYVHCIPSSSDTTILTIIRSTPLNETIKYQIHYSDPSSIPVPFTDVISLDFRCDGEPVEVKFAKDTIGCVPKGNYFTTKAFKGGENLTLEVEMEGTKRVSSHTTVPKPLDWELEINSPAPVENVFNPRKDLVFKLKDLSTAGYYAVSVSERNQSLIRIDGQVVMDEHSGPRDVYMEYGYDNGEEIMDTGKKDYFYYGGYLFFKGSLAGRDGDFELSVGCSLYNSYESEDDNSYQVEGETITQHIYQKQYHGYRAAAWNLSEELFRYYASLYNGESNSLAEFGLSAPSYAYSNIRMGLGCFGARMGSESEEFHFEGKPNNWYIE
ncbi:MAG: DUF4249 family protein [Bacteroidales bacterium]|nr:DUF4249 family protein [Bacteroidales bacterium]